MKKVSLAVAGFGLFALAACDRTNHDQLNSVDSNAAATSDNLNALSDQAANVASEAQVLENQAAQLNKEAKAASNAAGARTPADENIQGM